MQITLPNRFAPRAYQRRAMAYFDQGGKRAFTVWHRRGGKDLTAMHQTCKMAHERTGTYWHVFPTGEQGRKALWEGFTKDGERIMELVFPKPIRKSPREWKSGGEMVVELKCGSIWRLLGSDRMEVVGAGPAGVVFSEFALAKPRTWDLVRPMLRESEGWAWINTTPRGKNHAFKLFEMVRKLKGWFVDLKTLFDTRAYDPEQTIAEERDSGMPEELINQEYLCDWNAAVLGSFYGDLLARLDGRGGIGEFEHGTDNVFTFWDLGRSDDTTIWWMRPTRTGVDVLDHYAAHGEDLEHYFKVLEDRAQRHGWRYRKHYLPHDARAKTLATRTSIVEQAVDELGASMVAITPNLDLMDGVAAARKVLKHKGTRIHSRCSHVSSSKDCDGIEALRAYHREWDDDNKCFRETPLHDWSSHTADSFRYLAVVAEAAKLLVQAEPVKKRLTKVEPEPVTLGEPWEIEEENRRERV
jgi:phage terminase large subunit